MSSKVYYKRCFFCNYRVLRGAQSEYSFHRFPRDPITNKLWKRFCKLSDIDDVRNLFLCSKHFKKTDFIVTKSEQPGNGGARLNHDAVPTISKAATPPPTAKQPVKPMLLEVKNIVPSDPLDLELSIPTQIVVKTNTSPELPTLESLIQDIEDLSDAPENQVQLPADTQAFADIPELSEGAQFLREVQISSDLTDVLSNNIQFMAGADIYPLQPEGESRNGLQFLSETEQAFADAQELLREEEKRPRSVRRKYAVPRYMGDIMSSDLSTPKGALRTLEFARNTVAIQKKKLIAMQQKHKRLCKRVQSCRKVIEDLKQQNVVSEEVASGLLKLLRS